MDICLIRRETNGHRGHLSEMIPALADISGHSGKIESEADGRSGTTCCCRVHVCERFSVFCGLV